LSSFPDGVFVVSQSKEDIPDCKGLRDVAMATKTGKNLTKQPQLQWYVTY